MSLTLPKLLHVQFFLLVGHGQVRNPISQCWSLLYMHYGRTMTRKTINNHDSRVSYVPQLQGLCLQHTFAGRPRGIANNTTIHIQTTHELVWVDKQFIVNPRPNVTCYSLMTNGSSLEVERGTYPMIEDGQHARYTLRMYLSEADQTGLERYRCILSNVVGSTTVEFQVVKYTDEISKAENDTRDIETLSDEYEEEAVPYAEGMRTGTLFC